MMRARREQAVKEGKFPPIGDSKVPVVEGRIEFNKDPKTALVCRVSVPKNPHGVNAPPDGPTRYASYGNPAPPPSGTSASKSKSAHPSPA